MNLGRGRDPKTNLGRGFSDIGSLVAMFAPGGAPLGLQPLLLSCGFADKNAHIRVSVPTSTIAALAKLRP